MHFADYARLRLYIEHDHTVLDDLVAWFRQDRPDWQQHAACRGAGPEVFHPGKGQSLDRARELCAGCTVREPCLDYALEADIRHGVWGGLSPRERRALADKFAA